MAEDSNRVEIEIGAKLDDISNALNQLGTRFESFAKDTSSKLGAVGAGFDSLKNKILGLVSIAGAFEGIKHGVETTLELNVASGKLARQLGITQAEAGAIGIAMEEAYGSTEDYTRAAQFLARQLKQNEDRLNQLGVVTRDSNKELLAFDKITMNAIGTVNSYKQGTDRAAAGTEIFGRGALNNQSILKLTEERLQAAREKADELGLTMTAQGAAATGEYRTAMVDVHEVITGLWKVIGDAFMPILTSLGEWFAKAGPTAIKLFRDALNGIVVVVWAVVGAIRVVVDIVIAVVDVMFKAAFTLAETIEKLKRGDIKGALAAWDTGSSEIREKIKSTAKDIAKAGEDMGRALYEAFNPDPAKAGRVGDPGEKAFKAHLRSLVQQYDAELAEIKASQERKTFAEGDYQKFTLTQERDFWKAKLDAGGMNKQEHAAVLKKVMDFEVQIVREGFAAQQATLQIAESLWSHNLRQQLDFATQSAKATEIAFGGPQTKEAIAAWGRVAHIKQQIFEEDKKIAEERRKLEEDQSLHAIDMAQKFYDTEAARGHVSARDTIAIQQNLEDQRYAIQKAALERTRDLDKDDPNVSPEKKLQNDIAIEQLELQHQLKLADIRKAAILEAEKMNISLHKSIEGSFVTMIEEMTTSYKKLSAIVNDFLLSVWKGFMKIVAERFVERMFGAGTAGGAAIDALTKPIMNAIEGIFTKFIAWLFQSEAASKIVGATEIADYAAVGATAAMASVAAIPVTGWAMAPEVGAAQYADSMAYMGLLAAAGGTDQIQPGRPYLVGERGPEVRTFDAPGQILPNDALGGSGVHLHVHSFDTAGVAKLFQQNGAELARVLSAQMRMLNPRVNFGQS